MFMNRLLCGFSVTLRGSYRIRVLAGGGQRAMSIHPINDDIFGLNEDERQLRETVFNFVQKEVAPHAQEIDKTNDFKDIRKLWRKIGDLGLHGIVAPVDYGGTGGSYLDHCIIMEEFSRAAGGIALSYSAHSNLCVNLLNRNANDKQKEKYLPKLCSGEFIGGAAMTETEAGSDVLAMKTTAEKKCDYFVLNGRKCFATNGPIADVMVIYAKTDTTVESKRGITGFIVDTKSEGFKSGPNYEKLGMAGSATNAISFENLKVPAENVIGGVNQGVYVLMSGLDHERLVLAAGPIGLMQAAVDVSFDYAHQRKQMNQRIGQFQLIQGKMADMYTTLNACRSYLYNTARASCKGRATAKDCAGVLLYCGEKATQITLDAIQILGGNGYINEYPAGRFLRDAKCYTVAGGTSEIRRWVIGRAINAEYGER